MFAHETARETDIHVSEHVSTLFDLLSCAF